MMALVGHDVHANEFYAARWNEVSTFM